MLLSPSWEHNPCHTTAGPLLFLPPGEFQLFWLRLRFTAPRRDLFSTRWSELSKGPTGPPMAAPVNEPLPSLSALLLAVQGELGLVCVAHTNPPENTCAPQQPQLFWVAKTTPYVQAEQEERLHSQLKKWLGDFQPAAELSGQPVSRCWKPSTSPPQALHCFSGTNSSCCSTSEGVGVVAGMMRRNQPCTPRCSWLSLGPMGLLAMPGAASFLALFPWCGLGRRVLCFLQAPSICIPWADAKCAGASWCLAAYLWAGTPVHTCNHSSHSPKPSLTGAGHHPKTPPVPSGHAGLLHSHNLPPHLYLKAAFPCSPCFHSSFPVTTAQSKAAG